jgi:hypothetical protein
MQRSTTAKENLLPLFQDANLLCALSPIHLHLGRERLCYMAMDSISI